MLLRRALWAIPLFAIATHSQAYGEVDDSFHPPSVTGAVCSSQDTQLVIDNGYMFKATRGRLS